MASISRYWISIWPPVQTLAAMRQLGRPTTAVRDDVADEGSITAAVAEANEGLGAGPRAGTDQQCRSYVPLCNPKDEPLRVELGDRCESARDIPDVKSGCNESRYTAYYSLFYFTQATSKSAAAPIPPPTHILTTT